MEPHERALALHRLLATNPGPVSIQQMMEETGSSRATLYRDLTSLRDALDVSIDSLRADAGEMEKERDDSELPGVWLSSDELHALLATHQLIEHMSSGMLSVALAPLKTRIDALLSRQSNGKRWPIERVRVIALGQRNMDEVAFRVAASAVLGRKRLAFDYLARSTDERSHRRVSPQRLTYYRDNWYLDALDHDREALRSFAVDRISAASLLETTAQDVPDGALDEHLASGYGIFSGTPKAWATIVFCAKAARWVADTHWHSRQEGQFLADGRFQLRLPYSNAKELLMDVLRYGADAEITEPASLRQQARAILQLALAAYDGE